MAYNATSAIVNAGVYFSYNGVELEGVVTCSGLTETGTSPDVPFTNLQSGNFEEFGTGLIDPGNTQMTLITDPSGDAYDQLVSSQLNRTAHELRVVHGSLPTDAKRTDGSGFETASFTPGANTLTAALDSTKAVFTVKAAAAGALQGVRKNHFIQWGTTPTFTEITEVEAQSNGDIELKTNLLSNPSLGSALVKIFRPAFEIRRPARVMSMTPDESVNTAYTISIDFRNTGQGSKNVGTPHITI